MARSKINRKVKNRNYQKSPGAHKNQLITPASLGHRCPQDVQNAINFHQETLTEDVCQFLLSNPANLRVFLEFWSRPKNSSLTSNRAADTICGASWMLALNHLFLCQLDIARKFMLNGAFIHQCAQKPIEDILALCGGGTMQLSDHVVKVELPYYQSAFLLSNSKENMEQYLSNVIPMDFMRRMSFASHACHKTGSSTWVHDYVNCISNDWSSSSKYPKRGTKGFDSSSIHITILNTENNHAVYELVGVSNTLKELFTKYSEEQGIPLRSCRFFFDGKPLFLSTSSNKTPTQLGMRDHDVICVSSTTPLGTLQDVPEAEPKTNVSKKKAAKKRSSKSKRLQPGKVVYVEQDDPKIQHSQNLSRLFEEVAPVFKDIRQKLNNLALERTLRKERSCKRTSTPSFQPQPVNNPIMDGMAGKAGKSSYVIQVGEVNNLYKTSKKSQARAHLPHFVDLHGYTQLEALDKLNESLPQWEKYAMEGSYPFVAPVVIVCGGGNQILSQTVSQWIKENNVSNAPKEKVYARAA